MLSEEEWLRITQSFPSKVEQNLDNVTPNDIQSEDFKMRENDVENGINTSEPIVSPSDGHSRDEILESLNLKLRILTGNLMTQNRKIEEQEMEICNLRRKLTTEISYTLDQEQNSHHTMAPKRGKSDTQMITKGVELESIQERLVKLENKMQAFVPGVERTEQENDTKAEGIRRMGIIKPRSNLAANYRMASHNVNLKSSMAEEQAEKELVEDRIQNLEKLVDNLKNLMLRFINKQIRNKN